jgi:hypothetical protein
MQYKQQLYTITCRFAACHQIRNANAASWAAARLYRTTKSVAA